MATHESEESAMTKGAAVLKVTRTVLVVDWPSRDVPETLARAGFAVTVRGGPGPEDYSAYECDDSGVVARDVGSAPKHVDLIYAHRPMVELPSLVALAQSMGARAIWLQSGLDANGRKDASGCWVPHQESRIARELVESAGLVFLEKPYIVDAVRQLRSSGEIGTTG